MTTPTHDTPHPRGSQPELGTPAPYRFRLADDRLLSDHGWLRSRHTFSFAHHWDPEWVGYRTLLVINDDRVAGGRGFGAHPHRDMEIISYVLGGALEHRDSMGTGSVIRPGDVQRMSAGTGVVHSEMNHNRSDEVHFLQIWITPDRRGHTPSYQQIHVPEADKRGTLRLVAAPAEEAEAAGGVALHQDARLYAGLLDGDERAELTLAPDRHLWLHVARGAVTVQGPGVTDEQGKPGPRRLVAGDALFGEAAGPIRLTDGDAAEVLLFDLS